MKNLSFKKKKVTDSFTAQGIFSSSGQLGHDVSELDYTNRRESTMLLESVYRDVLSAICDRY